MVKRMTIGEHPRRTLFRMIILAACCFVIFTYAFIPYRVSGDSMSPTFTDGQLGLANRLIYFWREPVPGEVVVIRMAGRRMMYMKRVLAGPGDDISFDKGTLLVNGHIVKEPYLPEPGQWSTAPERLRENEYFVAGDNRGMPIDGHVAGIVSRSRIVGSVLF